jgi:hypothetical protein
MSEADNDYDLSFSIDVARSDTREAPWFGGLAFGTLFFPKSYLNIFANDRSRLPLFHSFPSHTMSMYTKMIYRRTLILTTRIRVSTAMSVGRHSVVLRAVILAHALLHVHQGMTLPCRPHETHAAPLRYETPPRPARKTTRDL